MIGICGQASSDYPEFAQFLVEQKIDSISLTPDTVVKTTLAVLETEKRQSETKEEREKKRASPCPGRVGGL